MMLEKYMVSWTSPSQNKHGSMPIGNGETGLNVWVEPTGDLLILFGRTDCWDEHERLCKIGRLRIKFLPDLRNNFLNLQEWRKKPQFRQDLNVEKGEITISYKTSKASYFMKIWVDVYAQVAHVEFESNQVTSILVNLELWRSSPRILQSQESQFLDVPNERKTVVSDKRIKISENELGWYHQNPRSPWNPILTHQGLAEAVEKGSDPILDRIFGAIILGDGMRRKDEVGLISIQPARSFHLYIFTQTIPNCSPEKWLQRIQMTAHQYLQQNSIELKSKHQKWWEEFWNRSWIDANGASNTYDLIQGYNLQRWMHACGGRGEYPIKFNGSIFTVDTKFDPDYRRWGGWYWFQNTRLIYWSMLASGDWDLMISFFRMFENIKILAEIRNKVYFNHPGWFFPETMTFYGAYANQNYGWDRTGQLPGDPIENLSLRWHYNGTLELIAMMDDFYRYTQDNSFLHKTYIPLAETLLTWWAHHWQITPEGYLDLFPSQALETYRNVRNPTPDVAGLRYVLEKLLQLSDSILTLDQRRQWTTLLHQIPPISRLSDNEGEILCSAHPPLPVRTNCENPELYAIFPFRLFGIGRPELPLARRTFMLRIQKSARGWNQDDTQAACLGLCKEAQRLVLERIHTKNRQSRFPAFWGPNYDWIPDQDHGSNLMLALQTMLLQSVGDKIYIFPAWPETWDIEFKLYTTNRTMVHARQKDKKKEILAVDPPSQWKNVMILISDKN